MLAGIFLAFFLMALVLAISIRLVGLAVAFSKITVAMVTALLISAEVTLIDRGMFLNFLAWFAIVMGVCFTICLLPRVNCALIFVCNCMVMAVLALMLFMAILPSYIENFELTKTWKFVVTGMVLLFALLTMLAQVGFAKVKELPYRILRIPDRIIASVIYTIAMLGVYAVIDPYTSLLQEVWSFVLFAVVGLVVAYLADLFVFSRILLIAPHVSEWVKRQKEASKKYNAFNVLGFLLSEFLSCSGSSVSMGRSTYNYDSNDDFWRREEQYAADRREQEYYDYTERQQQLANDFYDRNYGD